MKPTWRTRDGRVALYCGDCLDVLPTLEAGGVDAVVTDPPYSSGGAFRGDRAASAVSKYVQTQQAEARAGMGFSGDARDQRAFLAWCALWSTACLRAAKDGAVLCCFSDWRQVPILTDAVQAGGWTWRNLCTWWKPGCRMQRGRFSSSAEFIIYATAGPHASDGEASPQNVFQCATLTGRRKTHIAEKPQPVAAWAASVTRKGAAVLDPFFGTGSTALACIQTGRRFIGIEKEPKYFDIAKRRIQAAIAETKTRAAA